MADSNNAISGILATIELETGGTFDYEQARRCRARSWFISI